MRLTNGSTPFTVQVVRGFDKAAEISGTLHEDVTQFQLNGPPGVPQLWQIRIGGVLAATFTSGTGHTLNQIADALRGQLATFTGKDARVNQYLDLYVVSFDPTEGRQIEDVIQRRGEQATGYLETGFQLMGYRHLGYLSGTTVVVDDANVSGNAVQLYDDALHNLSVEDSGKPVFVIDQANASGLAQALYIDGLGRLTDIDTGQQALQITQSTSTLLPLYKDGSKITTRKLGSPIALGALSNGLAPILPLHYDNFGNKALVVPDAQKGFQATGYQAWGYLQYPSGLKSTTSIGAGYSVVFDFNDVKSVPLYIRYNSLGVQEITTERISTRAYIPFGDTGTNEVDADLDSVGDAYAYFINNGRAGYAGPLFEFFDSAGNLVLTDDPTDGLRPYIIGTWWYAAYGGTVGVPLYLDVNGNLTTHATDGGNANEPDWRRGEQRTSGGSALYVAKATSALAK